MALPKINIGFKAKTQDKGKPAFGGIAERLKNRTKTRTYKKASGSKFVLLVGDEGAILVYIKDSVVQSRQYVSDASPAHLEELKGTLASDEKAPVLLAVDSIDQTYVQQTLPPVSVLSVKKLIKRRLERDFGPNDIKGAIMLGRETGGRKDWNFMMVALERSSQLTPWLDFVTELPNRCQGIYLVSVEAEIMMHNLEAAMGRQESEPSEWKFLVSHNKVSGFRQVILRNGRIIFTRVAQPIGDSTPEVIAGSIEQEMLSTIEYMRRLSFSTQAGLDIYIIASSAIKGAIDRAKFDARNLTILTPYEVAQYLQLEGATQPTDQFGDIALAASIGNSRKHILTLYTPESKQYDKLYQALLAQRSGAALLAFGIVMYATSIGYDMIVAYGQRQELEHQKTTEESKLSDLRDQIKQSKLDVERTNDMIDLYAQLQLEKQTPLAFIDTVEMVIKPPIVVRSLEWSNGIGGPPGTPPGAAKMAATLVLDFPGVTSLEAFREVTKKLLEDLKKTFKGFDIAFTKIPTAFSEDEKLNMTFGSNAVTSSPTAGGAQGVELSIRGDFFNQPLQ